MSTQAKIHCINCSCNYYVYWSGISRDHVISCPHCDSEIDERMWSMIINAMGTVDELNREFVKVSTECSKDFFNVSIETYHVPFDKFKPLD